MATQYFNNSNTAASFQTNDANSWREIWQKGAQLAEQEDDFYQPWEGSGMKDVILSETDTAAKKGSTINFTVLENLYGPGVKGDELIGENGEVIPNGGYSLTVDYVRNAVSYNRRLMEKTTLFEDLKNGIPEMLGSWLGRKKAEMLDFSFKYRGQSKITNGKTEATLLGTDTLTMDEIIATGAQLAIGGAPAPRITKEGENEVLSYIFVVDKEAGASLKQSTDYKQAQRSAGIRGTENYIFKGGYSNLDGQVIVERTVPQHDGNGPISSPLAPKALLGIAITAGTTAIDITGGGTAAKAALTNPTPLYYQYFSNAAYAFTPTDTIAADVSTVRYVLIYNITGADAGKAGFYSYQVNDGNKITMVQRLGSSASGARVTTLGGVTWDTGDWQGKHTDAHPSGSMVIQANALGVPLCWSFALAAHAAIRGYGSERAVRTSQDFEGGWVTESYIRSIFGQKLPQRVGGRMPNSIAIQHAYKPVGTSLPVITAAP